MAALQDAKQQVLLELKSALGKGYAPNLSDLATPRDLSLGDVAFPCFVLAKGLKRNPVELATEIAAKIGPKGFIKSVTAAGPYVNFVFDDSMFGEQLLREIREGKKDYGTAETGTKSRVLVEYANPNTHKDVHVGHLRNFILGQVAVNAMRAVGQEVVPISYINDLGAHVAACLWGLKHRGEGRVPEKADRVKFLGEMYVAAVKAADADPSVKESFSQIHRELESGKGPYIPLWKKTRGWSVDYLKSVFKDFDLELNRIYFESDLIDDTKKILEKLIKQGIVIHSNGAWIVDLEAEKLGVNLLVKSDGTLLYNAKDLALAMRKEEDYHAAKSVYVVDERQSLAMRQLFATLKRMGFERELVHLSYEFVTLKEGAMASRKGNIIRYEQFRDAMLDLARAETKKRHADWKDKKIEKVAHAVAFAAIRFGMLKQDPGHKLTFDLEEALSFDGCTGPYLLYTYARMKSILRKAKRRKAPAKPVFTQPKEHALLLQLAAYPSVLFETGRDLHLSRLAMYAYEVCKAFAEYYEAVPVLASKGVERDTRLATVAAAAQVLKNAFGLLAIEAVKEM